MPQEIEVWYVLPAIRKSLVDEMLKIGMRQKDIATKIGVTEAAVSQYRKKKRAEKVILNDKAKAMVKKSALKISEGHNPIVEIQKICTVMRNDMSVCRISKSLGLAPKNCKKCYEDYNEKNIS